MTPFFKLNSQLIDLESNFMSTYSTILAQGN
ncbi:hypothetical protein KEN51_CDS0240 [Pseudomonas phage vB_Pae10145-KEN51]|nr:hypothetical protein [Pseudomonas phage ANB1]WNV50175.1 hypothetical protein [Pseudomonas phage PhiPizzaParty]WRQ05683.1 hypothetical protein IPCDMZAV_CDS0160 [Pseudomonas phage 6B]WRQ06180.1 hypothetical protein QAMIJHJT_CDS0249 [Pseudomonas phage 9-Ps-8B]WRQ06588.1 hypothetical protein FOPPYZMZ_CDS0248 [Pseudomonas phage 9Ps-7B]WRQ06939.1 hypothetical protein ZBUARNPM_CDS0190 [Pseudomonas phage 14Ps5-6]